jgi:hypothetical protein
LRKLEILRNKIAVIAVHKKRKIGKIGNHKKEK